MSNLKPVGLLKLFHFNLVYVCNDVQGAKSAWFHHFIEDISIFLDISEFSLIIHHKLTRKMGHPFVLLIYVTK